MDWEQLREKTLGEVGTTLATEGLGVTGGFLGAGFVGRQVENFLRPGVTTTSAITDKIIAWGANNIPKVVIWYLLRGYTEVTPGETVTPTKEVTIDAKKALAGSVIFDTIMRLANQGINPASASIMGWKVLGSSQTDVQPSSQADIQRLIQENSALRAELNKALQRLATSPTSQVSAPTMVQQPQVVRYQPAATMPAPTQQAPSVQPTPAPITVQPVSPEITERERRYGFMQYETTPPTVRERQRKYGFASGSGEERNIATMFGML